MSLWYHSGNGYTKTSFAKKDMVNDAYLVCTGPSLSDVDPDTLVGVGRFVLGINTSYPYIKPDMWIGMDHSQCYHPSLWFESFPKILRGGHDKDNINNFPIKSCPTFSFKLIEEIFSFKRPSSIFAKMLVTKNMKNRVK